MKTTVFLNKNGRHKKYYIDDTVSLGRFLRQNFIYELHTLLLIGPWDNHISDICAESRTYKKLHVLVYFFLYYPIVRNPTPMHCVST